MNSAAANPIENLPVGMVINGRWKIVEGIRTGTPDTTGGMFSVPYRVRDVETGRQAFLKVIDLVKAIGVYHQLGVNEALRRITENHSFEVYLSTVCRQQKMDRVVHALDSGEFPHNIPGLGTVALPYIVFELADGDTHSLLTVDRGLDIIWKVQILHQVATGLRQLHKADIAHQDVKRSNVVFFGEADAKITDLGRAVKKDRPSRNDGREIPCQLQNSPPELLYGYSMQDWSQRHLATDLYMLGNLAYSLFFDTTVTLAIMSKVPASYSFRQFGGDYAEVVPVLQNCLAEVVVEVESLLPTEIRSEFLQILTMLCNPDPAKRGHPRDHALKHGQRYSAERFISLFDAMKRKAKTALRP